MWSGHTSGQLVYPKKRSVTYPSVFDLKSNGAPDVSVRVNPGFGRAGVTNPPRYVASGPPLPFVPWATSGSLVPSKRASITKPVEKNTGFIWQPPEQSPALTCPDCREKHSGNCRYPDV